MTLLQSRQSLVPEPGWPKGMFCFWWRSDPGLFSCRYLYNRMGYWSDWFVPILMTTAAAFTYIAGLLVRGGCIRGQVALLSGEGRLGLWWLMEGSSLV